MGRGRLRPATQGPQPRAGPGRVPPSGQYRAGPERTSGQWARSPCAPLPAFPSLGWRDAGPRRPALLWVPHVPARAGLGSALVRSRSRGAAPAPPHPAGPRLRRPRGQRPPSPAGGRQREWWLKNFFVFSFLLRYNLHRGKWTDLKYVKFNEFLHVYTLTNSRNKTEHSSSPDNSLVLLPSQSLPPIPALGNH